MIINFNDIKFRPDLFKPEVTIENINKQVANVIWQSRDIAAGRFALRLFDNAELEIDEAEADMIREAAKHLLQWAQRPILDALNNAR